MLRLDRSDEMLEKIQKQLRQLREILEEREQRTRERLEELEQRYEQMFERPHIERDHDESEKSGQPDDRAEDDDERRV